MDSFYPTTFLFSAYDVMERSTIGNLVVLSVLLSQPELGFIQKEKGKYILQIRILFVLYVKFVSEKI